MSRLNFCCNISWLFRENEFTERFDLASKAGFKAVEMGWPYDIDLEKLVTVKEKSGLGCILMNTGSSRSFFIRYQEIPIGYYVDATDPNGDNTFSYNELITPPSVIRIYSVISSGFRKLGVRIRNLGFAAIPGAEEDFHAELDVALKYAKALKCKKIHIMAGKLPDTCSQYGDDDCKAKHYPEYTKTFIRNLQYAAEKLAPEGITGLIEPINSRKDVPNYFLTTHHQACDILDKVNRPNIKYQLDFYHLQIMSGNLSGNFKTLLPRIGHIQISQVPGRGEPSCPGEINYEYIFTLLENHGFTDWIGCEYAPSKGTEESLQWFRKLCNNH